MRELLLSTAVTAILASTSPFTAKSYVLETYPLLQLDPQSIKGLSTIKGGMVCGTYLYRNAHDRNGDDVVEYRQVLGSGDAVGLESRKEFTFVLYIDESLSVPLLTYARPGDQKKLPYLFIFSMNSADAEKAQPCLPTPSSLPAIQALESGGKK